MNSASAPGSGENTGTLKLPYSLTDFQQALSKLKIIFNPNDEEPGPVNVTLDDAAPRQLGNDLSEALFQGGIGKCYERAWQQHRGRLKLVFKTTPDDKKAVDFCRLPWELMRDPRSGLYYGLSLATGIVRYFESDRAFTPEPLTLPLKILVVLANPKQEGLADIQPEDFRQSLESIDWKDKVQLDFLETPTLRALGKKALEPYHIIHFAAHGGYMQDTWGLALERADGTIDKVSAEDLAATLGPALGHLRLVTLISCNSARLSKGDDSDTSNSVAAALVRMGVPAVIGTQFAISVSAAQTFTEALYGRMGAGDNLLSAVDEGRRAVHQTQPGFEWIVPVLYSRLENDRLFNPPPRIYLNTFADDLDPKKLLEENANTHIMNLSPYFTDARNANWPRIIKLLWKLQNRLPPKASLVVEGKSRLSVFTALGYVLSQPSGFRLWVKQPNASTEGTELWTTEARDVTTIQPDITPPEADSKDLIITLSVSASVDEQVTAFSRQNDLADAARLKISPPQGPGRTALPDGRVALALARGTAFAIRKYAQTYERVHLFIAAPSGFALFLGHHLNACGVIQLYEHLNPGYVPSVILGGGHG